MDRPEQVLPTPAVAAPSGMYLSPSGALCLPPQCFHGQPMQRNAPLAQDRQLAYNAPGQSYVDCRTIPNWMKFCKSLIREAWDTGKSATQIEFTHDYGLLPEDPKSLQGVIIVWELLSKVPAETTKSGIRQIKPSVREVKEIDGTSEWIWAQSFDCVMMFTVYGDTWDRMYEYLAMFEDLMLTYAGTFIGTGLQQFSFREQTRDALYDPPKAQAFPNKTIFYNARIEHQTKARMDVIESILIKVGAIAPLAEGVQDQLEVQTTVGAERRPLCMVPRVLHLVNYSISTGVLYLV